MYRKFLVQPIGMPDMSREYDVVFINPKGDVSTIHRCKSECEASHMAEDLNHAVCRNISLFEG